MDVALPHARARGTLAEAVAAIPTRIVLAVLVTASFVFRFVAALAHAVPVYFPDEYIYGALARSIATTGRPLIRGHAAHFPALLEPLIAAPFWLLGDPGIAYRLTQAENAFAISLAAVPVYLLSRRLGLGKAFAFGAAVVAVASPDLFFSSFLFAGPIGYPLALAAVHAGVCALVEPTRRSQLAFVAFSALASFARIQYVVLPLAFLVAAVVVERGSIGRALGRRRAAFGVFAALTAGLLAVGPARLLGYYDGVLEQRLSPLAIFHWIAIDSLLLPYSCGWIAVPGALVGLWVALRASSRVEQRAFGALVAAFALLLLVEAGVYASNGSDRYQERYLMALIPLVVPAFGIWLHRSAPGKRAVLAIAAGLVAASASMPLAGYAAANEKQDSPFLFAVFRLEKTLGAEGGSAVVAATAAVFCVLAVVLALRPRFAAPIAIALTTAVGIATSVAAYSLDTANARAVARALLPADPGWVDHAGGRHVAIVVTPGAGAAAVLEQAFWNTSVDAVFLLPGAKPPDAFGSTAVSVDWGGRLVAAARPVRRPLLIDEYGVSVELAHAVRVGRGGDFELWRPLGDMRMSVLTLGRYSDGWLSGRGEIGVWPDEAGWTRGTLRIKLELPPDARPTRLHFRGVHRTMLLRPGQTKIVAFAINKHGIWSTSFETNRRRLLWDGRVVGVRASVPTFARA